MTGTVEEAVAQMREQRRVFVLAIHDALYELQDAGRSAAADRLRGYLAMLETSQHAKDLRRSTRRRALLSLVMSA